MKPAQIRRAAEWAERHGYDGEQLREIADRAEQQGVEFDGEPSSRRPWSDVVVILAKHGLDVAGLRDARAQR